jgi:hypothetical protein
MHEWTGAARWVEAARETAIGLRARRGDDGLWRHGTSGNGFALLKAFARTGDERWLGRARRFAVHALGQSERLRAANGRGRYSLWTGDVFPRRYARCWLPARAPRCAAPGLRPARRGRTSPGAACVSSVARPGMTLHVRRRALGVGFVSFA